MKLVDFVFVQKTSRDIDWNKGLRRVIAVTFLAFLLVEWGSHNLAFAHTYNDGGSAVQSQDNSHEDPCKTLIRCSEGPGRGQPVLKISHDALQYNNFLNGSVTAPGWADLQKDDPTHRGRPLHPLFRPPDPLFHPPEIQ